MRETYTEKVHFKLTIEDDYICSNLFKEEVNTELTNSLKEIVIDYIMDNIVNYYDILKIELSNLEIKKE